MTLAQVGIIAEIIAAIAVVVSLFSVAVQLNKNTTAIRSSAFQGHVDSVLMYVELLSRPEMRTVLVKGRSNFDSLSEEEAIGFHALMVALFATLENVFFQRGQSVLEQQYWAARQKVVDRYIAYDGVRIWWEEHQIIYTSGFRHEINSRIEEVPNKSLNTDASDAGAA